MTRRRSLLLLLILVIAASAVLVRISRRGVIAPVAIENLDGARARLRSAEPPNIIFVLTDDQDYDSLGAMPIVNAELVKKGMTFTRHYVVDSLCCPSRSSILRSQFVHSHGVRGNSAPLGGFEKFVSSGDEKCTVANWLKGTGYRRALMGKYLNEYPAGMGERYVPPDWDVWASPLGTGGYSGYGYTLNDSGILQSFGSRPEDYFTDVLSQRAQLFVSSAVNDHVPFFLYVAPFVPHQPAAPAPRHSGLYRGAQTPRGGSYDQQDVSASPLFIQRLTPLADAEKRKMDALYRLRLESLQAVDEMVGALVRLLEERGALDNTYIIFTSDNGFHLGQHRMRAGKRTAYEEDIHVPLVIRGPGVAAGAQSSALTSEIDFAPTFTEWAGGVVPAFAEGRSLIGLLEHDGASPEGWRKAVLVEHFTDSEEPFERSPVSDISMRPLGGSRHSNIPPYRALRTATQLYVRYSDNEEELYDTAADPFELHNLAAAASSANLTALRRWLNLLARCSGANCRSRDAEQPLTPRHPRAKPRP